MRQGYLLCSVLFNILLEFLARAIRQEKEINRIKIGKEEIKLFLFADKITYLKDLPKHVQQSSRIQKIYKNQQHFYTPTISEKEIRKTIPFTIESKN
jgi:hypothetical protein